ncbi:glycosyltransferase family 4 protein [Anaerosalibacter massiliensis]|uniref:Glycosyltransferase family 4 protein n=1 Tax=Anaerosalibacter massiliensis TaxID=1347392 RepID=A0A9X2MKW7_9FIRM|nr:glycosyltransferase family 4 protein [Anaerosalibacter massiliensis]MCR2045371.1 glycosyltransferase family 4 protein [Anaerosalibacter massiliensis]
MKAKIIQLCAVDSTMGGLLRELNTQIIKEGYDFIGVCSKGKYTHGLIEEGFNIKNVQIDRSIRPMENMKTINNLTKLFKEEKPDIVHVHTPVASVLGRIAARRAKVPIIIYTAHGFYFHENMSKLKYKLFLNIEKHMARKYTDFIFTQSKEDCETALKNKFIDENRIMTIGNGVDIWQKFNPRKIDQKEIDSLYEELKINRDDKIVTFIGRLVGEKGILDLLEAFTMLNDSKIKLLVVGNAAQGERDTKTRELLKKYKKNKNIIFTGHRKDIPNILYITDIFCLPSYREGMPRSIIEAMAMESAVVATNIRGCREEVIPNETGYLVPIKSPLDIKEKILKLTRDEEKLENMKLNGRNRAELLFDENKVVRKQLDIFEALLEKKK